jgi:glycosyltransferase involved in cell wall biosynthesis
MNTMPVEQHQVQNVHPIERADDVKRRPLLSVVTPAYNEQSNLPILYERLSKVLVSIDVDWEWIVVDDHSGDGTFRAVGEIAGRDPRVHAVRFARNFGSHTAITCGLHHARGDCAVIMAADLQDPPEVLPVLLKKWLADVQVVWAVRTRREGEKASTIGYSRLYHMLMRHVVGLKEIPPTGADFFLLDRQVLDAFLGFKESNVSVFALINWMGFRQEASRGFGLDSEKETEVVSGFHYILYLPSYSSYVLSGLFCRLCRFHLCRRRYFQFASWPSRRRMVIVDGGDIGYWWHTDVNDGGVGGISLARSR